MAYDDYLINKNQDVINDLVNKTVQYLAAKDDKKQFRITVAGQVMHENEEVILDAELYNETYELINTPDVSLTITNADGKSFDFLMDRSGNRYQLNAGFYHRETIASKEKLFTTIKLIRIKAHS